MILLDTHVVVWANGDPRKLSREAASAIRRAEVRQGLAVSAISLVELARLVAVNRIEQTGTVEETIRQLTANLTVIPITPQIAAFTTYFPQDFSSDPADRIIAATARAEGMPLVTADERILGCPLLKTIW